MLYTLNLHDIICQLYCNKAEKKKEQDIITHSTRNSRSISIGVLIAGPKVAWAIQRTQMEDTNVLDYDSAEKTWAKVLAPFIANHNQISRPYWKQTVT